MEAYKQAVLEKIYGRCHLDPVKGCIMWDGCSSEHSGVRYGKIKAKCPPEHPSKTHYVHRLVFQFHFGINLDPSQHLSHLCHKTLCCSPHHLVIEPVSVNNARKVCAQSGRCTGHVDHPACLV